MKRTSDSISARQAETFFRSLLLQVEIQTLTVSTHSRRLNYLPLRWVGLDLLGSLDLFLEFDLSNWLHLPYNVSVVGGFSPRGGRFAPRTFAGRVGGHESASDQSGRFNALK